MKWQHSTVSIIFYPVNMLNVFKELSLKPTKKYIILFKNLFIIIQGYKKFKNFTILLENVKIMKSNYYF